MTADGSLTNDADDYLVEYRLKSIFDRLKSRDSPKRTGYKMNQNNEQG
jgi:hypothetical protein